MDDCVFCQIVKGKAHANVIDDGARWVAFEPLNPHAPGHVLFVPRVHVRDAAQSPALAAVVMQAASEHVWREGLSANVLTSVGAAATQTVKHLHVHVIPRGTDDGLHPDWPWRRDLADQHATIWETTRLAVDAAYGTDDRHGTLGLAVADSVVTGKPLPWALPAHFGRPAPCGGLDSAHPGETCPFPKNHGGPCFDNDDPTVDA